MESPKFGQLTAHQNQDIAKQNESQQQTSTKLISSMIESNSSINQKNKIAADSGFDKSIDRQGIPKQNKDHSSINHNLEDSSLQSFKEEREELTQII